MRSNTFIPSAVRCQTCKGWGSLFKATNSRVPPSSYSYNHGLPLHPDDMYPCPKCIGGHRLNVEWERDSVYCDYHGEIHPPENDYYEMEETECQKKNWRKVWVELPG